MRRHSVKLALVGGATVVVLAGGSAAAMTLASGSLGPGPMAGPTVRSAQAASASVPALPGAVVDVVLTDMGSGMPGWTGHSGGYGGMMGAGDAGQMMGSGWRGGMMHVRLSTRTVPSGKVSLRVADVGALDHELVVLPLANGARAGQRSVGPDGTVDEHGSLGEVSNNGGPGEGEGLHPGGMGWATLDLRPGRYELVCNLPGHYAAGMYAELEVTR